MNFARWLIVAGLSVAPLAAAHALPAAKPEAGNRITNVQLNCTGPRCLSTGPIVQPYMRGTRPPDLPPGEWLRRAPQRPQIRLQQPQMDYRVPKMETTLPPVRQVRPPAPSHQVIKEPSSRHHDWCAERYKSYRADDNSFQPLSGPRRPCRSPYG